MNEQKVPRRTPWTDEERQHLVKLGRRMIEDTINGELIWGRRADGILTFDDSSGLEMTSCQSCCDQGCHEFLLVRFNVAGEVTDRVFLSGPFSQSSLGQLYQQALWTTTVSRAHAFIQARKLALPSAN